MPAGRLIFLATAHAIGVPVMLLFRLVDADSSLFLPMAFVGNMVFMLLYGPALASLQEIVPAAHRGATVALFILVTSLIGSSGGAALVGALADAFAAEGHGQPIGWAIIVTQSIGLLAVPAFLFAAHYRKQAPP
jgi:hypothetical protein